MHGKAGEKIILNVARKSAGGDFDNDATWIGKRWCITFAAPYQNYAMQNWRYNSNEDVFCHIIKPLYIFENI